MFMFFHRAADRMESFVSQIGTSLFSSLIRWRALSTKWIKQLVADRTALLS
jgi:hypothetical protein